VLQLTSGEFTHLLALRTAVEVEPLTPNFDQGKTQVRFDLASPPELDQVKVEITRLEGDFGKPEFEPDKTFAADRGLAWIHCGGEQKLVHLKLMSTSTRGVQLTLLPYFQLLPTSRPLQLTGVLFQRARADASGREKVIGDQIGRLKKVKLTGPKAQFRDQQVAALETQLNETKAAVKNLDDVHSQCIAMQGSGRVHFRIYLAAGENQVDLVRSVTPKAPVEE
jgi:hypothetical protein